jgi:hypothetical protein
MRSRLPFVTAIVTLLIYSTQIGFDTGTIVLSRVGPHASMYINALREAGITNPTICLDMCDLGSTKPQPVNCRWVTAFSWQLHQVMKGSNE